MKIVIEGEDKKYYNKKPKGWSPCILGNEKHRDKELNVLVNCVGWAVGRFNHLGEEHECKYLGNANAEDFTKFCKTQGLELGQTPKVGACMVWEGKKDLAGHVAIVEEVKSDKEVITSESGWNATKSYWTQTRKKGTGNWGQNSKYAFKGFIYNPDVKEYWVKGIYKTLASKYIRTSPKVATNNYVLVKDCMASVKSKLTSKKPNDKARFKIGVTIELNLFEYDNKGNLWGKMKNTWLCVHDKNGDQVEKI